jgi:Cu(I)/Ag(I) efflux system protein CusF
MIMRTSTCALIGVLTLATASAASAQGASDMKGMSMAPEAKHGQAIGVIKAIDPKAGTLTIQHGPIPGVGWPAMTMTFTAKPPALLKGLKVGETIGFDATVRGAKAEVTAVRPK